VKDGDWGDAPSDIHVVDLDGSRERLVTKTPALYEFEPVWSADGRRHAFSGTRTYLPRSQVFVVNARGDGLRQLTHERADGRLNYMESWSADGRQIRFGRGTGTRLMNADGSNKRRLSGPAADGDPSPSGQWVVVPRDGGVDGDLYGNPDLMVMRVDGSERRWLTRTGNNELIGWSPDGSRILYSRESGIGSGLYVIDADGSQRRRLTHNAKDVGASWSPDGELIVFTRQDVPLGIYTITPDGRERRRLTRRVNDLGATWSPDGRLIACERDWAIWVVNRDGSGLRQLTRPRGEAVHSSPAWSPACA
jgi:Tol biopolymer transport system component